MKTLNALLQSIESCAASVVVVGLGYVGLPLAVEIASAGFPVTGYDHDSDKVASILNGSIDKSMLSRDNLMAAIASNRLDITSEPSCLNEAQVVVICVPTPLDAHQCPDLSHVQDAIKLIATAVGPGALIALESTAYPGCTRELMLTELEKNGFTAGADLAVAFSPERVDPGNAAFSINNTPKIVSGITSSCADLAESFYKKFIEKVVRVSTPEVAEMAKLLENIFRSVNIALVNEMALICDRMKINVWEVIDAAATKPFGFSAFYPGPGLGGHCIPVDPFYLSWKVKQLGITTEFIELAGKINQHMPYFVLEKIILALNSIEKSINGAKIFLLGMSYKSNVGDLRASPSLTVMSLLINHGAEVYYHDPHVPQLTLNENVHYSEALSNKNIGDADCIVILTAHNDIEWGMLSLVDCPIVDTRNVLSTDDVSCLYSL